MNRRSKALILSGALAGLLLWIPESLRTVFLVPPPPPLSAPLAALSFLPLFLLSGVLLGGAETVLFSLSRRLLRLTRWRDGGRALSEALAITLPALPLIVWFSWRLFQGKGISRSPLATPGPPLAGIVLTILFFFICLLLVRLRERLAKRDSLLLAAAALTLPLIALALLFLADATLYVRLYGFVHCTLALGAFLSGQLFALNLLTLGERLLPILSRALLLLLLILSLCAIPLLLRGESRTALRPYLLGKSVLASKVLLPLQPLFRKGGEGESLPAVDLSEEPDTVVIPPPAKGMNVLFVTIDALRADHLGCYGYGRATSPVIDALAEESFLFTDAYSPSSTTSISVPPILQARYAGRKTGHSEPLRLFRDGGYKTVCVFNEGHVFREEINPEDFDRIVFSGGLMKRVAALLEELKDERFFLWVHFNYPHASYRPPKEFARFGSEPMDLYDGEILFADRQLGEVLNALEERELSERTVVALAADHGEEFMDHGGRFHAATLYNEVIHVPLILRVPSMEGGVLRGEAEILDLLPTLLDLTGVPFPTETRKNLDGRSLLPRLAHPEREPNSYAYCEHPKAIALIRNGWKIIFNTRGGYHELYNLREDPGEKRNLAGLEREKYDEMRSLLRAARESARRGDEDDGKGAKTSWEELREKLGSPSSAIRAAAAEALLDRCRRGMEIPETIPQGGRIPPDIGGREAALRIALMACSGKGAAADFLPLLRDPRWEARKAAAAALGATGNSGAAGRLVEALETEEDWRVRAAEAVALKGNLSASLIERAVRVFEKEDILLVKVPLAATLAETGDPRCAQPLMEALEQPLYHRGRAKIVAALGRFRTPDALPILKRESFHKQGKYVRRAAFDALSGYPPEEVSGFLLEALRSDEGSRRGLAARALGLLGDPASIPALRAVCGDQDERVRAATAAALGRLGGEEAREALEPLLLKDPSAIVRFRAINALGRIGSKESLPAFLQAARTGDARVRQSARRALLRGGDGDTLGILKRDARAEKREEIRREIEETAKELEKRLSGKNSGA